MTPIPPYQPGQSLNDYVTSVIRTAVPYAWGLLITYLLSLVPGVAPALLPAMPVVLGWGPLIAAAVAGAWYALMRKIEPKLPAWLTVIVLGSNSQPKYLTPGQVIVPTGIQTPSDPRGNIMTGDGMRITKLDAEGNPTGESQVLPGPVQVRGVQLSPPPAGRDD